MTFLVGAQIHHEVNNDFAYVGAPFLMGTVALGQCGFLIQELKLREKL